MIGAKDVRSIVEEHLRILEGEVRELRITTCFFDASVKLWKVNVSYKSGEAFDIFPTSAAFNINEEGEVKGFWTGRSW